MLQACLLAALLPALLADQVATDLSPQTTLQLVENKIAKHSFGSLQEKIIENHGVSSKTQSLMSKTALLGRASLNGRSDLTKGTRASPHHNHEIVIAIKQRNMDKLEEILHDVSNPHSENFGKHLTRDQVTELTANPKSTKFVTNFLKKKGVAFVSQTRNGEYIKLSASVRVWEGLFQTQFFEYDQEHNPHVKIVRAEAAFLPAQLQGHVQHVFNVFDFPDERVYSSEEIVSAKEKAKKMLKTVQGSDLIDGYVTPAFLNQFYNIPSNTGSTLTSQAVFESLNQTYSPSDLTLFQQRFNLPVQGVAVDINVHAADDACVADGGNNCLEANLDVQYMMAVAQTVPMTYYYDNDWMLNFVQAVADMADPPKVISISYGGGEPQTQTYVQTFDNEAMKLGVMGVTLVASSGDDGVASFQARNRPINCGYHPSFPASSPYVTAVGGTFGPEDGKPEIACTSDAGGVITTGGGFSYMYPTPAWQQTQVTGYLNLVAGTATAPQAGYNPNGRGYPDVSALAATYAVMAAGNLTAVYGTSASSPVVAGMVALVNSARVAAGKSNLGWINPSIYQFQNEIVLNDITVGENNCVAAASVCCAQGFWAAPGWDPVSGIGSLDFAKFNATFFALGATPNAPTAAPTVTPGSPTTQPVAAPTAVPSAVPTAAPTVSSGWLTYTIYSEENCRGDALVVTGSPTNPCMVQYDVSNPSQAVGSQRYFCDSELATIVTYSDLQCVTETGRQELFLGCNPQYTTSYGLQQSSQLQCSAGPVSASNLPLPSNSDDQATYSTHLSYDEGSAACAESALSGFTSFLNGACFSEVVSSTVSFSVNYQFPLIVTYNAAGCPSKYRSVAIVQSQVCGLNSGDDDVYAVNAQADANEAEAEADAEQETSSFRGSQQQQQQQQQPDVQEVQAAGVETENAYYYYGSGRPQQTSRTYGLVVKSTVGGSSSSDSNSNSFLHNTGAVVGVAVAATVVGMAIIGVAIYFAFFAQAAKTPLLANQM